MAEMQKGLGDGLKDCRDPQGLPYDQELLNIFLYSFGKYFDSQKQDYVTPPDPDSYRPDASEVGSTFVQLIGKVYGVAPSVLSPKESQLGLDITSSVSAIYGQMMEDNGLVYQE